MTVYRNAIPAGERIGSYQIEKILGQGGFGITYLARDEKLERHVAIKEYFPEEFCHREDNHEVYPKSGDGEKIYAWGLERFLGEGKTLAKFKHPNIVRVIDYLEQNRTAYIVMEYEHGNDLQKRLRRNRTLPPDELLKIYVPLLDGLARVHQAGFIHRDIKPANIFIREDGSPVLIDFGSARQGIASRTRALTTLVSPGYAPFEQYNADSAGKQGPWTDIYALGASMYRTLFGRSPPDALSRAEKLLAGADDPYPTAASLGSGRYPENILQGIDEALGFLPNDRPQSIEAWLKVLLPPESGAGGQEEEAETVKLDPTVRTEPVAPAQVDKGAARPADRDGPGFRLAITKYIVLGMFSFWAYTSHALCRNVRECASRMHVQVNKGAGYLFPGVYILVLLLVLSWVVPNVFLGHVFGKGYILRIVLISSVLFYLNTVAFVLWYTRQVKNLDFVLPDEQEDEPASDSDRSRQARNALIAKWEGIDNHVVLFLVLSLPIVFSPFVCARLFFNTTSQALLLILPVIVMALGGLFHVWGTRLLVNTYNDTLVK